MTAIPAREGNLRTHVQAAWTLYDFANTIFSFAIVSGAIGLWLVDDRRFGPATGQLVLSLAISLSIGLNAIVSPVLGALSDCAAAASRSCSCSPPCASRRRP